jgi:urease accessory protein
MIIDKIAGNLMDNDVGGLECDEVYIEWYEAEKKVLHKISRDGIEIGIRIGGDNPLQDGDILYRDKKKVIVLKISECRCIALKPKMMAEMGKACYEIGNRHAPLFIEGDELLTPFDEPLMTLLIKFGFSVEIKNARLKIPLGGLTHGHSHLH